MKKEALNPFGIPAEVDMIHRVEFTDPVSGEEYEGLSGFKNFLIDRTGQMANAPDPNLNLRLTWNPTGVWVLSDSAGEEMFMSQDQYKFELS